MATITQLLRSPSRVNKVTNTVFNEFDKNHTGFVSERELEAMIRESAEQQAATPPTSAEIQRALEGMERSQKDKLTFPEFRNLVWKLFEGTDPKHLLGITLY